MSDFDLSAASTLNAASNVLLDATPATEGLEISGADRLRFLHGLVTCDVKALAPGSGCYGFFTTGQGKVLADFSLLAFADRLWLELPAGQGEVIAAHLSKYLIADRVEISPLGGTRALVLVGEGLTEVLPELDGLAEAPWSHAPCTIEGVEVVVARRGLLGAPAITLLVPNERAADVAERLLARSGVVAAEPEALERQRILAGIARFGVDFGPENFPQETGLEEQAVSYTKGCYLGQEVVARIHYRGGVQKALRGLRLGRAVTTGAAIFVDGRESGRVGSVLPDPHDSNRDEGWLALAILHKRALVEGAKVEVGEGEGAVSAHVVELPFRDHGGTDL